MRLHPILQRFACLLICALGFTWSPVALADAVRDGQVEAELLSEVEAIKAGQSFWMAIRLRMDDDWHTYWKNPGDSGLATRVSWNLPPGFKAGELQWPYPQWLDVAQLVTFGYEGEQYLLSKIEVPATLATEEVAFSADLKWLMCKEICVPGQAKVSATFGVSESLQMNKDMLQPFADARAKLPLKNSDWQVSASVVTNDLYIELSPPDYFQTELKGLRFFPETLSLVDYAKPQTLVHEAERTVLKLSLRSDLKSVPAQIEGVLVSESGWRSQGSERALQVTLPLRLAEAPPITKSSQGLTLGLAILFSFLGGLILNVMPCVLPVLSIKIMNLISDAQAGRAWRQGFLFAGGVVASFWVLALLLGVLKASGQQIGWGFQLQSSGFVLILSFIFFLIVLNLLGVFEVNLALPGVPRFLKHSAFASGVLTTIVATPCTAPFMGAALGFALTQPFFIAFLVFTFLGLGLAFPYVLMTCFPPLLKALPKPGPWMLHLKRLMAIPMVLAVVWLGWVLTQQRGTEILKPLALGLAMVFIGAACLGWLGRPTQKRAVRLAGLGIALITILGALIFVSYKLPALPSSSAVSTVSSDRGWDTYSKVKVDHYRAANRIVFIDFTAAWCLSCQVNKKVALNHPEVVAKFKELNVALLRADWTTNDPLITQALESYGRSGVPLYVLYVPGQKATLLPEILTPQIVLDALEKGVL